MKRIFQLLVFGFFLMPLQANEIDQYVFAQNQADQHVCSDEVFIRRTYLTLTGRLPESQQVKAFLASKVPQKRALIIDEILDSEEYVHYMVMRWGDILRIKSEFPSNLWPNGVQAYNRWLYEKMEANTPYNQFVSELLLSTGSNFRMPAVNFYRAFLKRTPENIYANIGLLFLGTRTNTDYGRYCFSQIKYKSTKEWKEEIVYVDYRMKPTVYRINMPDNKEIDLISGQDWRSAYVAWLTNKENKRFAGVMANRLWFWMLGKGIVNEPDDWGEHNLPSNPALMEFLTDRFIESGYDMKALIRLVLNSNAYQSACVPNGLYVPQRLPAEVLVDALAGLTGISDSYRSRVPEPFTFYPEGTRSVDLGDATVSSTALELFGRVSRDVSLESQRSNKLTSKQLLYLMNSSELEDRIRKSKMLNVICSQQKDVAGICREITLMTLSRYPTPEEITLFKTYASMNSLSLRNLAYDIMWTHINSTEFLFNH
ncbi:MAG TPA: DUF1553 domain-containing protein [Bacteroidales bacterium]|nr:DUF1553 domain-containing protein [Bacteroidales bacterium]